MSKINPTPGHIETSRETVDFLHNTRTANADDTTPFGIIGARTTATDTVGLENRTASVNKTDETASLIKNL